MKFSIYLYTVIGIFISSACATSTQRPIVKTNRTQIFDARHSTVFNAAITFLQSNAYSIELADKDVGIIKAMKETQPSFGSNLSEALVTGTIANLTEAKEYETTSSNIIKIVCYIEDLEGVKTEVKLSVKSGKVNDVHRLKSEFPDTEKYREYLIANNDYYQKWFNGLAVEIMNRKDFEKQHKIKSY